MKRAKVFISCGQRDNSEELKIAKSIAKLLEGKGYEPYIAKEIQTLGALTNEVYKNITDSEYFLFVDFKRESLAQGGIRGSLFSHQELAIASFKEMNVLTFREDGVLLEGMQSFILSNPFAFSNSGKLLEIINLEVDKKWTSNWKNDLELSVAKPIFEDAIDGNNNKVRYYHIAVTNRHTSKHASNCYGFIENIHCGPSKINLKNVHAVWSGYPHPSTVILPGDTKELDIFYHYFTGPSMIFFNVHATSGFYTPTPISQPAHHEFTIRVVSDNFPPAVAKFQLDFNGNPHQIAFKLA